MQALVSGSILAGVFGAVAVLAGALALRLFGTTRRAAREESADA